MMDSDAMKILRVEYQLNVLETKLLRERGDRRVWFIRTNNGSYCFKKYDLELDRYLFSFELQKTLMKKNSIIPRLIPTSNAHLYALDHKGRVYVLFEWIGGAMPIDLHQPADLKRGLSALARFHRDSLTFSPSNPIMQRNKRYRFDTDKEKRELGKLKSWNDVMLRKNTMPYHQFILEEAYVVIRKMNTLIRSGDLEEEAQKGYIAHNDFADINILATNNKTYIIDLDTVSYNFPTVDIVSIFIKTCSNKRIPLNILPLWLKNYELTFPLSPTLKRYLIYNLQLPTIYRRSMNIPILNERGLSQYLNLYNWEMKKNKVFQSLL